MNCQEHEPWQNASGITSDGLSAQNLFKKPNLFISINASFVDFYLFIIPQLLELSLEMHVLHS